MKKRTKLRNNHGSPLCLRLASFIDLLYLSRKGMVIKMSDKSLGDKCSLLKGSREVTGGDFYLDRDAADWNDDGCCWSYYLSVSGNMDEIFGTHVETDENDDYVNVYANISADYSHVEDLLSVILWKGDGGIEEYSYELSDREKDVLLAQILEYELPRITERLQEAKVSLGVR